MSAVTRAVSRAFSSISTSTSASTGESPLTTIAIFCGLGLLASLLCIATYGLDLSAGFF
jgi:hypothetical protein